MASSDPGSLLPTTSQVTVEQICRWIVQPETSQRKCSYAELVADAPQIPDGEGSKPGFSFFTNSVLPVVCGVETSPKPQGVWIGERPKVHVSTVLGPMFFRFALNTHARTHARPPARPHARPPARPPPNQPTNQPTKSSMQSESDFNGTTTTTATTTTTTTTEQWKLKRAKMAFLSSP